MMETLVNQKIKQYFSLNVIVWTYDWWIHLISIICNCFINYKREKECEISCYHIFSYCTTYLPNESTRINTNKYLPITNKRWIHFNPMFHFYTIWKCQYYARVFWCSHHIEAGQFLAVRWEGKPIIIGAINVKMDGSLLEEKSFFEKLPFLLF